MTARSVSDLAADVQERIDGSLFYGRAQKALAELVARLEAAEAEKPDCTLCHVPKATGDCQHIIETDAQITMSRTAWERLTDEVAESRNRDAAAEAQVAALTESEGNLHLAHENALDARDRMQAQVDALTQERDDALSVTHSGLVTRLMQRAEAAEAALADTRRALQEIERSANDGHSSGHIGFLARRALAAAGGGQEQQP